MKGFCHELEKKFLEASERMNIFGKKILIALSGGPDSTALLALFCRFRNLFGGIVACHLDHGIREESPKDAQFCLTTCLRFGIPMVLGKANLGSEASENSAREVRLRFLRETARSLDMDFIALGHTADDLAETVFFNIMRGAWIRGMEGFRPKTGVFVRPLYTATRQEVIDYLRVRKIPWRVDRTNYMPTHNTRAAIRHVILPHIAKVIPSVKPSLWRVSRLAEIYRDFFEKLSEEALKEALWVYHSPGVVIPMNTWSRLHTAEKLEMLASVLRTLGVPFFSEDLMRAVECLERGKAYNFHHSAVARNDRKAIYIGGEERPFEEAIGEKGEILWGPLRIEMRVLRPGKGKVRTPIPGDRFKGRKIKKLCWKIPASLRRRLPIVEVEGEIVQVCGFGGERVLDDRPVVEILRKVGIMLRTTGNL